jgi:hypothetical protein
LQYNIKNEQVEQVHAVLNSGAKWLKLGNDYINTTDIIGLVNEQVMYDKIQRKRGFFQLQGAGWCSKYDTQENFREPYQDKENNFKKVEELVSGADILPSPKTS